MSESEKLLYDLLHKTLSALPATRELIKDVYTPAEMNELLRLHYGEIHTAYGDFSLACESLNFIASDYQLRLKAEDIWKQQLEVFRSRIKPCAIDFLTACQKENIDVENDVEKIIELLL